MKELLRQIFLFSVACYITSGIFLGLQIEGGMQSVIILGALMAISIKIIKPIVSTVLLPLHILTLGLLAPLTMVLVLFIITRLYDKVTVSAFTFSGGQLFGIEIGSFSASIVLSYVVISVTIYFIAKFINFLFE